MASQKRSLQRHAVATVDEVPPGGRKLVEVGGRSIGLFNVHGTYRAVLNICPHALAPICRGHVRGTTEPSAPGEYRWGREGEILACPWHGWEYDLISGEALADRSRLHLFPVEQEGDMLYILLPSTHRRRASTEE